MADKSNSTAQAVERREHNSDTEAKRTQLVDPFGGTVTEGNFTTQMEYDGSNNPIYIGKAQIGTATSSPSWQIKQLVWTGGNLTGILWANGTDAFENTWDNRGSYTYS